LQDISEADALAHAHTEDMRGVLRVQAPPVLAVHILAPLVAGFRALYPGITLDIDVDSPDKPAIEDHDITLMGADANFDGNVIARPVIASHGVLVASARYVAAHGLPAQPSDLSNHRCLRLKMAGQRPILWRLQARADVEQAVEVPVQPVLWANHTDTLLRATHDGAGISAAPLELVAAYLTTGQMVHVLPEWITGQYTLFAAMPSRRFVPRRTRVFLDYLTEQTRANVAQAMPVPAALA